MTLALQSTFKSMGGSGNFQVPLRFLRKLMLGNKFIRGFCAVLVALVWLWPYATLPIAQLWPNLVAWVCLIIFLNLAIFLSPKQAIASVIIGVLVAATLSAVIGLAQYYGLQDVGGVMVASADVGQAYANTRQTNHYATLLGIGLLCAAWVIVNTTRWSRVRWMVMGSMVTVLLAGLAASASRTGLVHIVCLTICIVTWSRFLSARIWPWIVTAWGAYFSFLLLLPKSLAWLSLGGGRNLFDRLTFDEPCSSRLALWSNVVDLIQRYPWTGVGWGELAYAHYLHAFSGLRFCVPPSNAHNLFLHIAVEIGIWASVICLVFVLWVIRKFQPWAEKTADKQVAFGVFLLIGMHSMVEYPVWSGNFQVTLVLFVLVFVLAKYAADQSINIRDISLLTVDGVVRFRALSALLMAFMVFAGWDYFRISQMFRPPSERVAYYRDSAFAEARKSWLYSSPVMFGHLGVTQVTPAHANNILAASLLAIHYSPEPLVIERLIDAAWMVGRLDLARFHTERYRDAWPQEFAVWARQRPLHYFQ